MEIILTEDVARVGKRGEVCKVADGFARNFLIPKKLAMPATDSNKRHFEEIMRQTRAKVEKQRDGAEELAKKLDGEHIKFTLAFGETGKAYGSVTAKDIARGFYEKGLYFDPHQVVLDKPLKEAGVHQVQIHLFEDVNAQVKVWVVPEGEEESADESAEGKEGTEASVEEDAEPGENASKKEKRTEKKD